LATFTVKEGNPIGIKTPLRKSSTYGYFTPTTDILVQEKQNLLNLLMTNHGERPIHYNFGINIDYFLFEQITDFTKQKLNDNVVSAINKWLPHITIRELIIISREEDALLNYNELKIKMSFQLLDNPEMFDTIEILVGP